MMNDIIDKTVLIAGASSGIGEATVREGGWRSVGSQSIEDRMPRRAPTMLPFACIARSQLAHVAGLEIG